MSEPESIKVVLVDDHAMVRLGLEQLLGAADGIEVVGTAGDGARGAQGRADDQPRRRA